MKNTMKKTVALVLAVLMAAAVFSLTACDAKPGTTDDTQESGEAVAPGIQKIKDAGKLVLYTEAGFPPYEFIYNNELVGVDIEIVKAIAAEIGVELDIQDVNFDTIVGAIVSGKADIGAAGITIRDDRKESVDFTVPYSSTEQCVIVAAGQKIPKVEDLKGKKIGVQQGTTSDFLVEGLINDGTLEGCEQTAYNTPALAAAAIGKIDAVVTDKLTSQIIVSGSNGSLISEALLYADGSPVTDVEEYGIAISKDNKDLLEVANKVLNKLLDEGKVDAWTEEYNALAKTVDGE